jgi:hypothetical protein
MNILNWIKNQIGILRDFRRGDNTFTGAILPTEQDLINTPKFEDMVGETAQVNWKPLDITKVPTYPMYSQDGSSSCVAMSVCLIASILYYLRTQISIKFSASWVYQQRSNRQSLGMIGTEAFKIASKGLLPYELMPCMDLGETAINSLPIHPWYQKVADVFAFEDTLVQLPIGDIETVASVMQVTGKPINVWFSFNYTEWTGEPVVLVNNPPSRHSVVAVDYGIWNGKKCIVIQDSWGQNSTQYQGRRIISEDFFRQRNLFSAYTMRFRFDATGKNEVYNGSIISFQKCMRSLGLFPSNISFVENFGVITKKACTDFQKMQNIPVTGIIDSTTKAKLLELFNK